MTVAKQGFSLQTAKITSILGCCILLCSLALPAFAVVVNPLEAVNTSSPRASLKNFLKNASLAMQAFAEDGYRSPKTIAFNERAARSLDISEVAPAVREGTTFEAVLLLKEVFDRIPLPPWSEIPGKENIAATKDTTWRIPGTEIIFTQVMEGPRKGNFLLSAQTVANAAAYYRFTKDMPQHSGKDDVGYEDYIYSGGWMIPARFLDSLPKWAMISFMDQALWQWAGLFLTVICSGILWFLFYRLTHKKHKNEMHTLRQHLVRLIFLVGSIFLAHGVIEFLDLQINITGDVLVVTTMLSDGLVYVLTIWAVLVLSNIAIWVVQGSQATQKRGLDAGLLRLLIRIISLAVVFFIIYNAAAYFGIPVTAVFASAGIAGVAVALAARETLANFFGGISIFLDRPFRSGDYIVLEQGERGEVTEVGLRSTRIRTRDDVMITIPNSVITNVKIINESAPVPHYRVRIAVGVAYGSDIDLVEELLMQLAHDSTLVAKHPEPRVRFRTFGDSSLDFELLCWAKRPHDRGRLIHELNCAIYKLFAKKGIEIPFPQRDVYLRTTANADAKVDANAEISSAT